MSEMKVTYGNVKREKKTGIVTIRLAPSTLKNLILKSDSEKRKPAELARVLVERYVDR